MIAGVVVILFIVGLFLEMLSSSPKPDPEWQSDTECDLGSTPAATQALTSPTAH